MPGSSDLSGRVEHLVASLPDIAGLSPPQWMAVLLIAAVFAWFMTGNPSRSR